MKVPRKWMDRSKAGGGTKQKGGRVLPSAGSGGTVNDLPRFEPKGGWETVNWQLIEDPITLRGPDAKKK